jgi:hypothetical protein
MAYRHEVLTSCSRKLALFCGLLLLPVGQAWSAGAPSAPQVKRASVNDVTLANEEQGDGAPVIFIQGCCTDYRAWDAQRQAMLAPAIGAAKAGDAAGAARLVPIVVNHQPDFWGTATPDTRSMFADNARTIPLVFITAPPPPPMTCDQLRRSRYRL